MVDHNEGDFNEAAEAEGIVVRGGMLGGESWGECWRGFVGGEAGQGTETRVVMDFGYSGLPCSLQD